MPFKIGAVSVEWSTGMGRGLPMTGRRDKEKCVRARTYFPPKPAASLQPIQANNGKSPKNISRFTVGGLIVIAPNCSRLGHLGEQTFISDPGV